MASQQIKSEYLDPVLIVSIGRSGSTLLMRLLNTIDGVFFFGEHAGAFKHLFEMYKDLIYKEEEQLSNATAIINRNAVEDRFVAWARPFSANEAVSELGRSISYLYNKRISDKRVVCWGFKEIRYTIDHLIFFTRIWPEVKFVFLKREVESGFRSWYASFARTSDDSMSVITNYLDRYENHLQSATSLAEIHKSNVFEISYEQIVSSTEHTLVPLFSFMGIHPTQTELQKLNDVMLKDVDYVKPAKKNSPRVDEAMKLFYDAVDNMQQERRLRLGLK